MQPSCSLSKILLTIFAIKYVIIFLFGLFFPAHPQAVFFKRQCNCASFNGPNRKINYFFQRFHEFFIRERRQDIQLIRKSLTQIHREARLGPNLELIVLVHIFSPISHSKNHFIFHLSNPVKNLLVAMVWRYLWCISVRAMSQTNIQPTTSGRLDIWQKNRWRLNVPASTIIWLEQRKCNKHQRKKALLNGLSAIKKKLNASGKFLLVYIRWTRIPMRVEKRWERLR